LSCLVASAGQLDRQVRVWGASTAEISQTGKTTSLLPQHFPGSRTIVSAASCSNSYQESLWTVEITLIRASHLRAMDRITWPTLTDRVRGRPSMRAHRRLGADNADNGNSGQTGDLPVWAVARAVFLRDVAPVLDVLTWGTGSSTPLFTLYPLDGWKARRGALFQVGAFQFRRSHPTCALR
jgi:hypothetical protein